MTPSSDAAPRLPADPAPAGPGPGPETRPFYWSVRRELWENRFLWIAPPAIAAVVLLGSAIRLVGLARGAVTASPADPAASLARLVEPIDIAPAPIMLASFLIGAFFCLDALYGERRDRSILFWKSLPVSDRTTVLAKASLPLVGLPLLAFALSVLTQVVLVLVGSAAVAGGGGGAAALWSELRFFQGLVVMLYGLAVHALWFSPIYAWLLLLSAWARRAPLLWAVIPPLVAATVEHLAFATSHVATLLQYRVAGAMAEAFVFRPGDEGAIDRLSQLTPLRFLGSPGLWLGLAFAAACLAGAVRLRRRGTPL